MATWDDVCRLVEQLPGAVLGQAHEGSPAYYAGHKPFARLRWEDDREILQFWSADLSTREILGQAAPDTFFVIHTFAKQVSVWAWLDRLDPSELEELLADSWLARAPARLMKESE